MVIENGYNSKSIKDFAVERLYHTDVSSWLLYSGSECRLISHSMEGYILIKEIKVHLNIMSTLDLK